MIIRGEIQNGGFSAGRDETTVMVRVRVRESDGLNKVSGLPSNLRGRRVVIVIDDDAPAPPWIAGGGPEADPFSAPQAATAGSGPTPATVGSEQE